MKRLKFTYTVLTASLFVSSCTNDDFEPTLSSDNSEEISFRLASAQSRGSSTDDLTYQGTLMLSTADASDSLYMKAEVSKIDDPILSRGALSDISSLRQFAVTCVRRDADGNPVNYYFKDNIYNYSLSQSDWINSLGAIYYWAGTQSDNYDFYAYSPIPSGSTPAGYSVTTSDSPSAPVISYTVPATEADQIDLLATSALEYPGNWGKKVDLSYDHILTAVQFKMGNNMAPGYIEGIRLSGLAKSGSYNLDTKEWTLDSETQTVSLTKQTASSADAFFNNDDNSFLLLPQSLEGVQLTILYHYTATSQIKELTTSLADLNPWQAGQKVVYTFIINPELNIGIAEMQDAHYTMVEVPFEVVGVGSSGNYTLNVSCDDGGSWASMRTNLVGPETSGYWIENTTDYSEFNRSTTISGTGDGKKSVWVFLTENAGTVTRSATFTLTAGSASTSVKINQLSPSWTGEADTGWERLESEDSYPFGFDWTRVVTYSGSGVIPGILYYLMNWFGSSSDLVSFYTEGSIWSRTYYIKIDYSKANELGTSTDDSNGKDNTWTLYSKAGFSLDAYENTLDGYSSYFSKSVENSTEKTDNYAALVALKCNPFTVERKNDSGQTVYNVTITQDKIKWFLAAPNQFVCNDTDYPMNGIYWSSNASETQIDGERCAYYVNMNNNNMSSTTDASREEYHKVRALRIAP